MEEGYGRGGSELGKSVRRVRRECGASWGRAGGGELVEGGKLGESVGRVGEERGGWRGREGCELLKWKSKCY